MVRLARYPVYPIPEGSAKNPIKHKYDSPEKSDNCCPLTSFDTLIITNANHVDGKENESYFEIRKPVYCYIKCSVAAVNE